MTQATYQTRAPTLEQRLLELIRVGAAGDAAGVRQLANRLARQVPDGIDDPRAFRESVGTALSAAARNQDPDLLRSTKQDGVPVDRESSLPVAKLDTSPDPTQPIFDHRTAEVIETVLEERAAADSLSVLGLQPARTVLLCGPPGVGKTMLASYVASRLDAPLLTIDLAAVMSSYLGRTAQNLRAALEYGRTRNAVVFLDEFDALAKHRDDDADVGELKRLVNVLLGDLEQWPSESLLIAATNHKHLLDRAMERRFDRVVPVGLPGRSARRKILHAHWPHPGPESDHLDAIADVMDGLTGSDVASVAHAAAKTVHIRGEEPIEALCKELCLSGHGGTATRDGCIRVLRSHGLTQRSIAATVGVSHPTVSTILKGKGNRNA